MGLVNVAGIFALALAAYDRPASTAPVTTLCDLAAKPEKWRGRVVRLAANYVTDRLEYSLLKDERCPKIWFSSSESRKGDRVSLRAFERAVVGDGHRIPSWRFAVEIIGRVSYRRDKGTSGRKSSGRIEIIRVLTFREMPRSAEEDR